MAADTLQAAKSRLALDVERIKAGQPAITGMVPGLPKRDRWVRDLGDDLDIILAELSRLEDALFARTASCEVVQRERDDARRQIAETQAKSDMLADSNYLAGVMAGWNAAQSDNPNEALAKIQASRQGHIAAYRALQRGEQPGGGEEGQGGLPERLTDQCGSQPEQTAPAMAALAMDAHPSEDEITQILFSVQRGAMRLRVAAVEIMNLYEAAKPSAWRYEFSQPRQEDGYRDGSTVWHVGYSADRPTYEVRNLTALYERRITSV